MTYKPRLTSDGMKNNKYWYSGNPFTKANCGLPNCTCYAWGRFAELMGTTEGIELSKGNAEDFFGHKDSYERGSTPQLGAIICLKDGPFSGYGHVAVVEKIEGDKFTLSQSGWGGDYFWCDTMYASKLKQGKMISGQPAHNGYIFQGFIYHPNGEGGLSGSSVDMAERIETLYSSATNWEVYTATNEREEKRNKEREKQKKIKEEVEKAIAESIKEGAKTVTAISDAFLSSLGGEFSETKLVKNNKVRDDLSLSRAVIEAPFVELNLNGRIIGSYMGDTDMYPNYISKMEVDKVNGEINKYKIQLVYQIRAGEDPNQLDKIISEVRYGKIGIRYGDCVSGAIFQDTEAIITNVTASRDYNAKRISYQIECTSACNYVSTFNANFPRKIGKPSNIIRELLWESGEMSKVLLDAFPGMRNRALVESRGLLPSDDIELDINQCLNYTPLEYINYLVSNMSSNSNDTNAIKRDSVYYIYYLDDTDNEFGGSYFKIVKSSASNKRPLTNSIYNVVVGYPDNNCTMSFNINENKSWALLYDKFNTQEYAYSINSDGSVIEQYSPHLSMSSNKMNEGQKNWWTQMTSFPITATLTIRGLMKPVMLMDYVSIGVVFYGAEHISSGVYNIVGQKDILGGAEGFRTVLSLVRVGDK